MRWVVVMALKTPTRSNTRLAPAIGSADDLVELTRAMRADAAAAVRASSSVIDIVLVVDEPDAVDAVEVEHVVVQRASGLNAAMDEGRAYADDRWPDAGAVALVGDLPALRPHELDAALTQAGRVRLGFVPDHTGHGTTMLTAAAGQPFVARFGPGSAVAHAEIATALTAGPGLRTDVDTAADLAAAAELGVGPRTAAVLSYLLLTRREDDLGHEHD